MKLEERLANLQAQEKQGIANIERLEEERIRIIAQVNGIRGAMMQLRELITEAKQGVLKAKPKRRKMAAAKRETDVGK